MKKLFIVLVLGPHLVVLKLYSWLQGNVGGPCVMPVIESKLGHELYSLAISLVNTIPTVLFL